MIFGKLCFRQCEFTRSYQRLCSFTQVHWMAGSQELAVWSCWTFWPKNSMMGFYNSCKQNYPSRTTGVILVFLQNGVEGRWFSQKYSYQVGQAPPNHWDKSLRLVKKLPTPLIHVSKFARNMPRSSGRSVGLPHPLYGEPPSLENGLVKPGNPSTSHRRPRYYETYDPSDWPSRADLEHHSWERGSVGCSGHQLDLLRFNDMLM